MTPYRSILVGADFSDRSKQAFRVACSLADETRTRMFVLHVADRDFSSLRPIAFEEVGIAVPIPAEDVARDLALRDRLRDEYVPSRAINVEYLVRSGVAEEEILRTSRGFGNDLIVMGSHGRGGLRRLLAGSAAEAVLRRSLCPVLALSSPENLLEKGEVPVILHPTDFSEEAEAALWVAGLLARDLGARLVIVHVVPLEVVAYGTVPVPFDMREVRDQLDATARLIDGADLKYPVETRLTQGDAVTEILAVAREIGCGMVVIGTHGRTGLSRLFLGSVAESVLRKAPCPVLVAKVPQLAARQVETAGTRVPGS